MKLLWLIGDSPEGTQACPALPRCLTKLVSTVEEALAVLLNGTDEIDACLVVLQEHDGREAADSISAEPANVLEKLLSTRPGLPVIFMRSAGTAAEAVSLLKAGAWHFYDKMPDSAELSSLLELLPKPQVTDQTPSWRSMLVGSSKAMMQVVDMVGLIADRRSTVLVLGETGTGKEMIARALHLASQRNRFPLVAINCAAIPEESLEAELFGQVKGGFTGASLARVGCFEQAHQSTLLLDEIGDMPLDLQAKLLRALQEREIQRVGSPETVHVDVRVVAATNADLFQRVKKGRFREDLYYRLNVVPLRVPSLRERPEDVPALIRHFIKKVCDAELLPRKTIEQETVQGLCGLTWPGNIRQLENAVEMAVVLSGDRPVLTASDFALLSEPDLAPPIAMTAEQLVPLPEDGLDFEAVISKIELDLLEQALKRANGNKKIAADILRLKRTTLAAKLKTLGASVSISED